MDDSNAPITRTARMSPSSHFDEALRSDAVEAFGSDGAWLILSIVWYGWRSYYDLAVAAYRGPKPEDDPRRPHELQDDYQVALDLHLQTLVFSATEQLATLVTAARAHQPGTTAFFDAYVTAQPVGTLVRDVQNLTMQELETLAGVPASITDLADRSPEGLPDLDPGSMRTIEVDGLHIPASVKDKAKVDEARRYATGFLKTITQLTQLVERPPGAASSPRPQPLREVDNAFRHGHRVFFHDAVPDERRYHILGDPTSLDHPSADLFMPRNREKNISWATIGCSPERTQSSLRSLRELSLCVRLFVHGFLGRQAGRGSLLWVAATSADLPDPEE